MTSATSEDHRPAGNYRLFTHLPEGVSHAFYSAFLGRAHYVGPDFVRDRVARCACGRTDHGSRRNGDRIVCGEKDTIDAARNSVIDKLDLLPGVSAVLKKYQRWVI